MEIRPEKITLAREARGLTQKELSQRLDIVQGTLSKIEQGLQNASDDFLKKLSEILNFPISFFSLSNKVHSPDVIYFRKRLTLPKKTTMKIEAKINVIRIVVERLLENVELVEPDIPSWDVQENGPPLMAAKFLRSKWKIPRGRIENLTSLLEQKGIIIIPLDFESSKIDGISMISERHHPIVFLNSLMPNDRQRLSLAHELGHLIMHFGKVVAFDRDLEKEAFEFASELLVPGQEFGNLSSPIDLRFLANQKLYWKVSMASLLYKVKDLHMATDNQLRYLWSQMSTLGYKSAEPNEFDLPKENPSIAKEMLNIHLKDLNFSKEDLTSITCLYWNELEKLLIGQNQTNLKVIR